jgi:hypothetical protein
MSASGQIRAGAAYVELLARDNLLSAGLKRAEAKIKAFGAVIAGIGTKFAALGAAMWTPLLGAAKSFAESGTQLLLMSQRTGVSVEALSALKFAAAEAGVEAEDLEHGFKHMGQTVQHAADGSHEAQQALAGLGTSVSELMNLTPDKQFERLADGIAKIQNPTTRAARAIELFGRGGLALLPLLNKGAAGIAELRSEAERLGLVKSKESVDNAFRLEKAFQAVHKAVNAVWNTIGGAIAPLLTDIFNGVIPFIAWIRQWAKENKAVFNALLAIGGAASAIGAALIGVAGAFKMITLVISPIVAIMSLVSSLISGLIGIVGLFLTPLGFVLGAVVGIGVAVLLFTQQGKDALASLVNGLGAIGSIAKDAWSGISDAIASNDWAGAMRIAWLGIQSIWFTAIATLRSSWRNFSGFFVDTFWEAVRMVSQTLNDVRTGFAVAAAGATGNVVGMAAAAQNGLAMREQINAQHQQEQNERFAARTMAETKDNAEIEGLRLRMANEAAIARQKRIEHDWLLAEDPGRSGAGGALDQSRAKVDVAGSFSSFALGGLGASSVTESLLSRIADNTDPSRGQGNFS